MSSEQIAVPSDINANLWKAQRYFDFEKADWNE